MNNKILIKIIVPELDKDFDVFIPVNEVIWKINKLVTKSIFDMMGLNLNINDLNFVLLNKETSRIYQNNEIIIDTDIRNGTELILIRI